MALKDYIRRHPLAFVLIVAAALRLIAIIWSQGFIHSDDHFDTVEVCYNWLQNGLWHSDGYLHWRGFPSTTIVRNPLYTLVNYFLMVLFKAVGITALDKMMYGIRAVHGLLSLWPVWAIFKIIKISTGDNKWAMWGGLAVALHCALPFLGVRNLIEMVGGALWMVAIYYIYRYRVDKCNRWLYWSGILTGLAWMMRFQIAFAVLPIPFILWYEYKSIKPALHYSAAVGAMLLLSGIFDRITMGYFAASTINNLALNVGQDALYSVIPILYPAEIILFLIPPFSVIAIGLAFRRSFWKHHLVLAISTLFFVISHMIHPNQQERFMLPVIFCLLAIAVLALWHKKQDAGYILKNARVFKWLLGISLALNFLLLPFLTTAYGHKGLIEPLIKIERMNPRPYVIFMQPGMRRWIPVDYAGFEPLERQYIRSWEDWETYPDRWKFAAECDYFVLYPPNESDHQLYLDSLETRYGELILDYYQPPSSYDWLAHALNPRHNRSFEAWIYRRAGTD